MRPCDSAYDRDCAEWRVADPGEREYALVTEHNGPCSLIGTYACLADAIEAARTLDTDDAPTELSDALAYEGDRTRELLELAEEHGWMRVARAPAGEEWIVLAEQL